MVTENVILWYSFLSQLFKLHWKKNQNRTQEVSSAALLQHFSLVLQRP